MINPNHIDDDTISFVTPDFLDNLPYKRENEIDDFEFGIILVDDRGVIKLYNKYQADLEGIPQSSVKGKNYFTKIMPCTCNRLFYERFKVGVSINNLDFVMLYVLTYRIKPTQVKVHLFRDANTRTNWILMIKQN